MRNFTSMLGLTQPYTKKGIYELTPLGEEVVATEKKEYLMRTCDAGEPCREVCPTGAIGPFKLNPNCIACGLCVQVCPYGALSLDCEKSPQLKFEPEICKRSVGTTKNSLMCDFGKITAEELSLQRWIKQVFRLVGITSLLMFSSLILFNPCYFV
ncbi:MAG: hypothetical protein GPJ51_01840 [Candidatus Heimdallarchaeota archaeon]|nr:hypothetical protein [Candidatus Heimdallarchaeota archaeon]